jgi:hypothetical protein
LIAEHQQGFGDCGLGGAAVAKVRRNRLIEAGLVVRNRRAQPRQPVEALRQRRRRRGTGQLDHAVKGLVEGIVAGAFQRLVHAVPRFSVPEAGLLRTFWQARAMRRHLQAIMRLPTVIKS